jgi:hypothetical protein
METEIQSSKSVENRIFYILIFVLSILAILFGTFFNKKNATPEPQNCQNEAVNYP